ncbi:SDR family NAD(P)-dependent oxidoreductase [Hansschlegelia plantiphila]|uniref:Oxidoreductase n=1 Tax=Hansschlegelia plantiphila TaxID=374655 RepID=A0A9W6MUK3_9HYPH|nr:glucose 1-dehydrogenase [Hansschlegelia plantiphila]GLK66760.1 oxidoreductase [Hansschlegelia plantiphila]
MGKLEGKVAVVTGASKGIGAGIAKALAAEGASVVVNYASSREGAERVVSEIASKGGKAVAVHGDVAVAADVKRIFAETKSAFGRLDVLVNNAGVYKFGSLEEFAEEEFHRQYNINVLGTILSAQEALKHFGPEGGNIINISSVVGSNPAPNSVIYSSTKGAVDNITVSLSRELGARNIRVNAIAPGATESEGFTAVGIAGTDFEKTIISATPLGRLGRPDDIGKIAVFLASDESSWLTGEIVSASGGWR